MDSGHEDELWQEMDDLVLLQVALERRFDPVVPWDEINVDDDSYSVNESA
jgi:hypothetical protein